MRAAGVAGGMVPFTEVHRAVLGRIPRGRANAETSAAIRRRILASGEIRLSDVAFRTAVKELIEEHGQPVGSSPSEPPGFYMIDDPAEAEECVRSLMSRARSIMRRAAALRGIAYADAVEQLKLWGGE